MIPRGLWLLLYLLDCLQWETLNSRFVALIHTQRSLFTWNAIYIQNERPCDSTGSEVFGIILSFLYSAQLLTRLFHDTETDAV
jgi:hypothetical protein